MTPSLTSPAPDLVAHLPHLRLDPAVEDIVRREGRLVEFRAGEIIFKSGAPARGWLFVLAGTVRVSLVSPTGREILLYRVGMGDACVLTSASFLTHAPIGAEGVAETPLRAVHMPQAAFRIALDTSAAFREHVMLSFAQRMQDLVTMLEETAFLAIPNRLAKALVARAVASEVLATHQTLAAELGTAREVVTRALKVFETEGTIRVSRGRIVILDPQRISTLAQARG